jgi:hypothetical protein
VGDVDESGRREAFRAFCRSLLGKPYIWGADGPNAFDCSGLAQALLARLQLDPQGDQTADAIYRHFRDPANGSPVHGHADLGCLAFFGSPHRIGHVGVCLDRRDMIEAAKGGPEITTVEAALAHGAAVAVNPITRRRDLVAVLRPNGLPWAYRAGDETVERAWQPDMRLIDAPPETPPVEISGAEVDALNRYLPLVREAGDEFGIDLYILCGIGSRESRWGLALRPPAAHGTGDFSGRTPKRGLREGRLPPDGLGFGRGLLQIDWDAHPFARGDTWRDPRENIRYGARVLRASIEHMRQQLPHLAAEHAARAGIAGYNAELLTYRYQGYVLVK